MSQILQNVAFLLFLSILTDIDKKHFLGQKSFIL